MVERLFDDDIEVRLSAINTVVRLEARTAVAPLIDMLKEPNPVLAAAAAEALGRLAEPVAAKSLCGALRRTQRASGGCLGDF